VTHSFDFKAIGYGVATFVVGYMILGIFTTLVAGSHGSVLAKVLWPLVELGGTVLPAIAGYVSAYYSRSRHIINGTIGGSLGMALFLVAVAFFIPAYPAWGVPFLVAIFALIASLGAIVGNYMRSKHVL
jgi:hypothetical protein